MTFKLALIYLMIAMALIIVYFWTHQKSKKRIGKGSLAVVRALVLFALVMLLIITIMRFRN